MYLKVNKQNEIEVRAPKKTRESRIKKFVEENIIKFSQYIEKSAKKRMYSFEDDYVFYFGKKTKLKYMSNVENPNIRKSGNEIWLLTKNGGDSENLKLLNNFIKNEILIYIKKQQIHWEKIMKVPKHEVFISFKTTTWGTNNVNKKQIRYSWLLGHYNKNVIDYLIIHELAHHLQPNHSDKFWNIVKKFMPTYKIVRKILRSDQEMAEE